MTLEPLLGSTGLYRPNVSWNTSSELSVWSGQYGETVRDPPWVWCAHVNFWSENDQSTFGVKTISQASYGRAGPCLTQSVYNVALQKSIPAQIRQLILYISDDIEHVDGFVRELTFYKMTVAWELTFVHRLLCEN